MFLMTWLLNPNNLTIDSYNIFDVETLRECMKMKYGSRTVRDDINLEVVAQTIINIHKEYLITMFEAESRYNQILTNGRKSVTNVMYHDNGVSDETTSVDDKTTLTSNGENVHSGTDNTNHSGTDNRTMSHDTTVDVTKTHDATEKETDTKGTALVDKTSGGDKTSVTNGGTIRDIQTLDTHNNTDRTQSLTKSAYNATNLQPYESTTGSENVANTGTVTNEKTDTSTQTTQTDLASIVTHTNSGNDTIDKVFSGNDTDTTIDNGNSTDNRTVDLSDDRRVNLTDTTSNNENGTRTSNGTSNSNFKNDGDRNTTVVSDYTPVEWQLVLEKHVDAYLWLAEHLANALCRATLKSFWGYERYGN